MSGQPPPSYLERCRNFILNDWTGRQIGNSFGPHQQSFQMHWTLSFFSCSFSASHVCQYNRYIIKNLRSWFFLQRTIQGKYISRIHNIRCPSIYGKIMPLPMFFYLCIRIVIISIYNLYNNPNKKISLII